ncbi:MAG: GAF domain-containing sensor histidine kinase, partial [Desulfobulbaceae bacterium]|nr:GAF domain-containing sensor histidine kinase [Desulfobulbaceae bacterium]
PDGLGNDQLKMLIEAAKIVNSNVTIDEVLNSIVNAATSLTNADRGTLYIFDREKGELWSRIIRGENIEEIRLKLGQGIAGWVAENGETVNLEDVSADERFDSRTDLMTGYETKSMLCFPIKNKDELTVGVLQLINSSKGKFLQTDEDLLAALSAHAAIALENASLVQQLLRNDRITYLGKVANFIISDLRKPILTIKHYAEHIKKKNITPDIRQVLDMIVEQTTNIIGLVQTTLSYSEGKTILQTKVQSLNTVMDEILEMLAEYVESMNVKLFKKYGKDVYVKVDKKELYQALFQITKNACEAMPEGGNFYISTAPEENSVTLSFKDIGLGIPPALKERVFEPFMTHGKKNGVGLGLPLAEKIIKEHGGEITIESEVGEGANFIVKLPIYS